MRPVTLVLHLLPDQQSTLHGSVIDPLTGQRRPFVGKDALWDVIEQVVESRTDSANRSQSCFTPFPASPPSSPPSF